MRRTSEKPFAWIPADGRPSTASPALDAGAVDQALALDDPDAGAAEVDLVLPVDAGKLCGLATENRAPRRAADVGGALDEVGDLLGVDRVGGDVVEEEQRLGTGREHVVDAMRGEVGTAPAQLPGAPPEHELGADRVGRGREQPPVVDGEEPRERAERARDGGRRGRCDGRAQPLYDRVGRREGDARSGIRQLVRHLPESTDPASTVTP